MGAGAGSCHWLNPTFSPITLVLISLLVVIISGPIYLVLSFVSEILSARTHEEVNEVEIMNEHMRTHARIRAEAGMQQGTQPSAPTPETRKSAKKSPRSSYLNPDLHESFEQAHRVAADITKSNKVVVERNPTDYQNLKLFVEEMKAYESTLSTRDLWAFQAQWPLLYGSPNVDQIFKNDDNDKVVKEFKAVLTEAASWFSKLEGEDDAFIGLKILELFVDDLIGRGTRTARVFNNQVESFKNFSVVSWGVKGLTLSAIL